MPRELPVMSACFAFCAMAPPSRAVAAKGGGRTPHCNYSGIMRGVGIAHRVGLYYTAGPPIVHPQLESRDLQVGWAEGVGVGREDQCGHSHAKTPAVRSA